MYLSVCQNNIYSENIHRSIFPILVIKFESRNFLCDCRPKKTIDDLLPADAPDDGKDLLRKLVHFNPDKRLTAEQALKHPYVARLV